MPENSCNRKNTSQPPLYPMNKGLEAVRFALKPHPKVPRTSLTYPDLDWLKDVARDFV